MQDYDKLVDRTKTTLSDKIFISFVLLLFFGGMYAIWVLAHHPSSPM